MPYVNIRLTPPGLSRGQKEKVIEGVTQVLVDVLGKSPATTFVVIDEVDSDNWGMKGTSVTSLREKG